jgi:SAM-dependent methyltransferase
MPEATPSYASLPPAKPSLGDCLFYHSFTFPSGESVEGLWDLRGRFADYIGNVALTGKSVLDVGTASGFLAFEAERAGAKSVMALDGPTTADFERVPFRGDDYLENRAAWVAERDVYIEQIRNSFWYAHYEMGSKVEATLRTIRSLPYWDRQFDVVIAGAIVEHHGDPVSFIGAIARLAKETVIIGFTDIIDVDALYMAPHSAWTDPKISYGWWRLTRGLYARVFENLGFSIELSPSSAIHVANNGLVTQRTTLVATRRH